MRDAIEQGLAWALIVGLVCAVVLGRRRGLKNRSDAIAQAHAAGFAEGGKAAASALAQNTVNLALGGSVAAGHDAASCADPWSCSVCGPVLARVAGIGRGDADHHGALDYDHDVSAHHGDVRGYHFAPDAAVRGVPVERLGTGAVDGRGPHGVAGALRVRPDAPPEAR